MLVNHPLLTKWVLPTLVSSPARTLFGAVFLVFSSISGATIAQTTLPPGWQRQSEANGTIIYTYGTGLERILRASFTPEPGVNLDQSIEGARGVFRAYAPCLGIDNAAIRSILAGKGRQISWEDTQNRCIIIVVAQKPNADLIIGWEPKTSTAETRQLALSLATGNISTISSSKPSGAASKNSTTPTSRPLNQPTQGTSNNNGELAKALAQVPVANRPVAIILRGELRATAGSNVGTMAHGANRKTPRSSSPSKRANAGHFCLRHNRRLSLGALIFLLGCSARC